jgi:rhodanese-related sulfurtransferase
MDMTVLFKKTLAILLFAAIAVFFNAGHTFSEIRKMTGEELNANLDKPEIVIIDVRYDVDWRKSDRKIRGAVREEPKDVDSWAGKYPKEGTMIFYCACPNEITSISVALELMVMGYKKLYILNGGWDGWVKAGFPTENK